MNNYRAQVLRVPQAFCAIKKEIKSVQRLMSSNYNEQLQSAGPASALGFMRYQERNKICTYLQKRVN